MAIKCDNCSNSASYTTADPGVNPAHYCTSCLPAWLYDRANAGHFPLMETIAEPTVETSVEDKPKKKAAPKSSDVQE
jgi:hypothetical protein